MNKSPNWFKDVHHINIRLVLEYTEYADSLMTDIIETSTLKNRIDLAIEACGCLLANLCYAYFEDKPLAIQLSRPYWKQTKSQGYEWATLRRVQSLLDTMEILGIVGVSNGFYSKDKGRFCSKYWLNIEPPIGGIELSMLTHRDPILVTTKNGGLRSGSRNSKYRIQRNFLKRYNKFMEEQNIRFEIKLEGFIKNNSEDPKKDIINTLASLATKVNARLVGLNLDGMPVKRIKVFREESKPIKVELSCIQYNSNNQDTNTTVSDNTDTVVYDNTDTVIENIVNIKIMVATIPVLGSENWNLQELKGKTLSGTVPFVDLYRQFCLDSMKLGGRFYSDSFSSLPRAIRKNLTINDEPVSEPDYSGLHIRLLYNKEQIDYRGECYVYDKADQEHHIDRERMKLAQLIMINAGRDKKTGKTLPPHKAYRQAKFAIFYKLQKKGIGFDTENEVDDLMKVFENFHPPLKKYLYKDKGVELQFCDSEIMIGILKRLTAMKIPSLPVHDSLVVPAQHEATTKQIMIEQYEKELGFEPVID